MIDLKRLHKVHDNFPNNTRKSGKTFYCFDQLLRTAQTGVIKKLLYVTNDERSLYNSLNDFLYFLTELGEEFQQGNKKFTVFINDCEIKFISLKDKKKYRHSNFILDLHY